jgi:hypothetical protein
MKITHESFLAGCRVLIDNGIEIDEVEIVMQALCYVMLDIETEQFMTDGENPFPCCQSCANFQSECGGATYHQCDIHSLEHYKVKV